MVTAFNRCKVDAACIGNHELDFGIEQMDTVLSQTMSGQGGSCQWVMTNIVPDDKDPVGPESVGVCMR